MLTQLEPAYTTMVSNSEIEFNTSAAARSENDDGDRFLYGIVIDSGSSGSRIVVYRWPQSSSNENDESILKSPPRIVLKKDWTFKILPGILHFRDNAKKLWPLHFVDLIQFAENIVPPSQHSETPVFVLATAGMRLLSTADQKRILKETCKSIRQNSRFHLPDCKKHVQVIDGATEGIYGWLSANYLLGQFNNYDSTSKEHESIGFMDMGGALTQIAFVPSLQADREEHHDDLSRVILRNVNGDLQDWRVFVETWLGFGANEARRRFLNSLVDVMTVGRTKVVSDPCMPRGAKSHHLYRGVKYKVLGTGRYETCLKTIYPLLLKNLPCDSSPCLFNGVHGPRLDFKKDKFVGISEYWYTANDVFQSGGEYDYHGFNLRVKDYCESDWSTILQNAKQGKYSGLDPEKFLKNACFKASWVLNILHEGFELPRLGIDVPETSEPISSVETAHVPFKSASSINGEELSWTLGKMLMFASSQIPAKESQSTPKVGIYPKEVSRLKVDGNRGSAIQHAYDSSLDDDLAFNRAHVWYLVIVLIFLLSMIYRFFGSFLAASWHKANKLQIPVRAKSIASDVACHIPGFGRFALGYSGGNDTYATNISLEEGTRPPLSPRMYSSPRPILESSLRTRSSANLQEQSLQLDDLNGPKPYLPLSGSSPQSSYHPLNLGPNRSYSNPFQKPFGIPKKFADSQVSSKTH